MNILSVETSTDSCSAAIATVDKIYLRSQISPQEHSKLILHMIDEIIDEAELTMQDIDIISFGVGPGSFTGLRIAAGVVQGLAFLDDKPIVQVSTLQALAQAAYKRFGYTEIFAALDARMQQIYYGFFKLDADEIMQPCFSEGVDCPDKLIDIPPDFKTQVWHGVGLGVTNYHHKLETSMPYMIPEMTAIYPSALEVSTLARKIFAQKGGVKVEQAQPIYIRDEVVKKRN